METGDDWKPLFVGSVIGGASADNRASRAAVSRLAKEVGRLAWTPTYEESGVDVAFHIPGPMLEPEHSGIRTGRTSKKERLIAVQIAVPSEIRLKSEFETLQIMADYLVEGVELAQAVVARRKGMPPVLQAHSLVRLARDAVRESQG